MEHDSCANVICRIDADAGQGYRKQLMPMIQRAIILVGVLLWAVAPRADASAATRTTTTPATASVQATAVTASAPGPVSAADGVYRYDLFTIRRSTNRNQIQYQLQTDGRCNPDPEEPIRVFWRRYEHGPHVTRELKWVENQFAFGVDIERVFPGGVQFVIVADKTRSIRVVLESNPDSGGCDVTPYVRITSQWRRLESVYVMVQERRFAWPKVPYVDVFGRTPSGKLICGRIHERGEPDEPCPHPFEHAP